MGKLVDQNQLRPASQRCVDVELFQRDIAMLHDERRQHFKPVEQLHGFRSRMRLDITDQDIDAAFFCLMRGFEHGVGFADPGGVSEEYLQPAFMIIGFSSAYRAQK